MYKTNYSHNYSHVTNNTTLANCTGTYSNAFRVNVYSFAAAAAAKKLTGNAKKSADAERAITDTIQYLGWMSLKNDDHNGTDKDVKQATERRAAADRLIARGTVVLLGTWSNGIAVGPGAGFSAATAEVEVIAPVKATRKARKSTDMLVEWHDGTTISWNATARRFPNLVAPGASCSWSPDAMHGPAFVAKPRVRVPLATMQACSPRWVAPIARDEADDTITATIEAITGEEYDAMIAEPITKYQIPAQWYREGFTCDWHPGLSMRPVSTNAERIKTNIDRVSPIYTPAVGDTIEIRYQHERMTTDRVITVQRVAADGKTFRGYDRTYDRVRNYEMDRVLTIRRIGGEGVEVAAG